jgi:single-strand DNA-binding protein
MRTVNKVILIGNLTRDPDLKQTQSGQNVCVFGMATNREWITKEGDRRETAEFHELVSWGGRAEVCHKLLHKGDLTYIEGYLKTRSWEGEDGKRSYRTEIVISDMIKLEKRKPNESLAGAPPKEIKTEENNPEEDVAAASAFSDTGEEVAKQPEEASASPAENTTPSTTEADSAEQPEEKKEDPSF